jgi:lipopolysaccharide exporter
MSVPHSHPHYSPKRQMLRGSIWAMALRWSVRLTGLVSTVILARLLTPADFGLVTIASLIIGIVEVFSQSGPYAALTRHPNPTREHYDSAWTVALLLGVGASLITWASIPFTTAYFHEPRAAAVVAILAVRTMLVGAVNIGIVNFRRNLEFDKQFRYNLYPTLISFTVTICAAFTLRNYWALVIGIITQLASTTVLSYVMDPYRPRICFSKVREIWSFSAWILLRNIGEFAGNQFDKFAIGGFAGAAGMGRYYVAQDIATSPTQELVMPMTTVLLPVMAKVQDDKRALRDLYLAVVYWSALICFATSIGVALVAQDMATLVLGPKWTDVAVLMPWFALSGVAAISYTATAALDTIGQPKISTKFQWIWLAVLSLSIVIVARFDPSLQSIAITRLVVSVVMMPVIFFAMSRAMGIPFREFAVTIWRPAVSGLVMAIAVLALNSELHFTGPPRLFLDVALGAATYGGCIMLLWVYVGRPSGPEAEIYGYIRRYFRPSVTPSQPAVIAPLRSPEDH